MTPYYRSYAWDTELGGMPTSSPAESVSVTAFPHLADIFLEWMKILFTVPRDDLTRTSRRFGPNTRRRPLESRRHSNIQRHGR